MSGINFAVVVMATGQIISTGFGPADGVSAVAQDPGHAVIEVSEAASYRTHWFDAGEVKDKTPLGAAWDKQAINADGMDTATLSGLPVPCTVLIDGEEFLVEDGSLEFVAMAPGDYFVSVDHPEHYAQWWVIDAD